MAEEPPPAPALELLTVPPALDLTVIPSDRLAILFEVSLERMRQVAMYPTEEDLPDGTWAGGMRLVSVTQAKLSCERAQREGRITNLHITEEEFCEVAAEEDPIKLRAELVQLAACAVKWIETIDRREHATAATVESRAGEET